MKKIAVACMMFASLGLYVCLKGSSRESVLFIDEMQIEAFGKSCASAVRKMEEELKKSVLSKEDSEKILKSWKQAYEEEQQRNKIGY